VSNFDVATLDTAELISTSRLLDSGVCDRAHVEALWAQKSRLDRIFDAQEQTLYYEARHAAFPQDKHGSERGLRNRAGDKLLEIHECVGILEPRAPTDRDVFIDICGGPGAWSELILRESPKMRGYGITLDAPMTQAGETWYERLVASERWKPLWGADKTGNIYPSANIAHVAEQVAADRVVLAVGDGGFAISKADGGEHMENLQELFSTRIVLSELLIGGVLLAEGGNFVCKLFDTFSLFSASVIYSVAMLFESAIVVKPRRSRIVNSERYLVGRHRRAPTEASARFVERLRAIHAAWDDTNAKVPISLVPLDVMRSDAKFMRTLRECTQSLCEKQAQALAVVLDKVEDFRKNGVPASAAAAVAAARGGRGGFRGGRGGGGRGGGRGGAAQQPAKPKKEKQKPVIDADGFAVVVGKPK
jgi:cap1 methyltransferase